MYKRSAPSKDEFLRDLRAVLYILAKELNRIYGGTNRLVLANHITGKIAKEFDGDPEQDAAKLDISDMPVTHYMEMLYDFAIEARLDKQLDDEWMTVDEDIEGFFRGLENFPLIENNADYFPLNSCLQILDLCRARRVLDNRGFVIGEDGDCAFNYMQLKDVALLAGIDEKTARNLAHPEAKNRLITTNWKGRTLVEINFAREWLKKRGFRETVTYDSQLDRDLSQVGFWSLIALGNFVRGHRERHGWSINDLAERAGIYKKKHWLKTVEAGSATFDQESLTALAKALGIEIKPFVLAALEIIQENQIARVKSELN